jgi:tetratricopeptide (TPR) repeat protein
MMKRIIFIGLVLGLSIMLFASAAWAEEGLWGNEKEAGKKTDDADAGESAAPEEPPVDLEAVLSPEQYQRAIKPILAQTEKAEKVLKLYEKEMAKPDKTRNEKRAIGHKDRAARFYLAASLQARKSKNYVREAEHKAAIQKQFEEPLQTKAIAIYLELAQTYMDQRNVRKGVSYYKQVLKIDPKNPTATEELKKIEEVLKEAQRKKAQEKTVGGGGHDDDDDDDDDDKDDWDPLK